MITINKFGYHSLLYSFFISLILLQSGCNYEVKEQNCPTRPMIAAHKTWQTTNNMDSISLTKLTTFFATLDVSCQNEQILGDSVMLNLFNNWLSEPNKNISLEHNLQYLAHNNTLPDHYKTQALLYLTLVYYSESKIKQDDSTLTIIKSKLKDLDSKNLIIYYRSLGLLYTFEHRLEESVHVYQKVIELLLLSSKIKNAEFGVVYGNLANVYMKLGNYYTAIFYMKEGLSLITKYAPNCKDLPILTSNLGLAYSNIGKTDSALYYYNLVLGNYEKNGHNNVYSAFLAYINTIDVYKDRKNFAVANSFLAKASLLKSNIKDSSILMLFYLDSTFCNSTNMNIDKNIGKINEYLLQLYKCNDLYDIQLFYQDISKIYQQRGNYEQAFAYEKKKDSIKEIASSADYKIKIDALQTKYNVSRKVLELQKSKTTLYFSELLIAVLTMLIVATIFIFILRTQRQKRKIQENIAELSTHFATQLIERIEEERSQIAMELHDDINQDLMFLKKEVGEESGTISQNIDAIINKVRHISRSIYPVTLRYIGLEKSITTLCNNMIKNFNFVIVTEIVLKQEMSTGKQLQIFRIIQESINNALKHANASECRLSLQENEVKKTITLEVKDNGNGFDVETKLKKNDSFGLHSISKRANAMGAEAQIESSENGTLIRIVIPI